MTVLSNLVLGYCGAGIMRLAARHHGLVGDVHVIPDDLGHGPLDDGVARLAYMRRCFAGCADWTRSETDAFASWHELTAGVEAVPRDLVVWRGENVSETVLLAMACWWLRNARCRLLVAELPDGRHIGTFSADDLSRLQASRRALHAAEIDALATRYERLRAGGGIRRKWAGDTVVDVPASAFDHLLLSATDATFAPAVRVIAEAMTAADPRDGLSDIFLCSRLLALIAQGLVEADRPPRLMRDYAVRRLGS
jgi:hypothetical protein